MVLRFHLVSGDSELGNETGSKVNLYNSAIKLELGASNLIPDFYLFKVNVKLPFVGLCISAGEGNFL